MSGLPYPAKLFSRRQFKDPAVKAMLIDLALVLEEMQRAIVDQIPTVEPETWTTKWKLADTSITNDATVNDDPDLQFDMLANTKYAFRMHVFWTSGINPDFRCRHTGPAAPTKVKVHRFWTPPGGAITGDSDLSYSTVDIVILSLTGLLPGYMRLDGVVENGANAGPFKFQWAQGTSDPGTTSVTVGSYVESSVIA